MLSLRDSGKIQQDNASLTDLARQCDLTVPFSLKDFIEKDCLVEVTNFRICVVLFIPWRLFFPWQPEYTRRLFIATKHDRAWYENYFLNWRNPNGIAQYWHKETFGRVKVEGDVLDWTVEFDDPADILDRDDQNNPKGKPVDRFQPGNRVAREKVAALAAKIALQKGVSVGDYDGLIAVVRMPHNWNIDGDWGGAANFLKSANFIDGRGDFAFYAHEVGHVIGFKYNFDHSWGKETTEFCYGLYGHPYCVMGNEALRFNPPNGSLSTEEQSRPPGLNGATRYLKGWATGIEFDLNPEIESGPFTIQSLGANHPGPHIVYIRKGERTYAVEYRSWNEGNDRGIGCFVLVVSAVRGGKALEVERGENGTYLGEIRVEESAAKPVTDSEVVNFDPHWGIKIVTWTPENPIAITFRIVRNFRFSLRTYARTHPLSVCNLCNGLKSWTVNGQPLKSLKSLVPL